MKRKDLFNQRELELMENYYRERRPLRENLVKFIGIVDKSEAKTRLPKKPESLLKKLPVLWMSWHIWEFLNTRLTAKGSTW